MINGEAIKGVEECLRNIGIFAEEGFYTKEVSEYIEDSLSLIIFIVELEQYFNIEITDDDLSIDSLNSFPEIIDIITKLVDEKENDNCIEESNLICCDDHPKKGELIYEEVSENEEID